MDEREARVNEGEMDDTARNEPRYSSGPGLVGGDERVWMIAGPWMRAKADPAAIIDARIHETSKVHDQHPATPV